MNRKIAIIAVFVLLLAVAATYGVWLYAREEPSEDDIVTTYTLTEVAKHDAPDDCWLVIDSEVYDVTDFLADHPPGAAPIERNCGSDASAGFGGVRAHGDEAESLRNDYHIGSLAE